MANRNNGPSLPSSRLRQMMEISAFPSQGSAWQTQTPQFFPSPLTSWPGPHFLTPPLHFAHGAQPFPCVPLPHLFPEAMSINPLLLDGEAPLITYDISMSPSSARCQSARQGHTSSHDEWRRNAATYPLSSSLTIRTSVLDRPIVVFPPTPHTAITVEDVLVAVHRAFAMYAVNDHAPVLESSILWQPSTLVNSSSSRSQTSTIAGRGRPSPRWRWAGLKPSSTERDVWILVVN